MSHVLLYLLDRGRLTLLTPFALVGIGDSVEEREPSPWQALATPRV